jgi:hypothetical protein
MRQGRRVATWDGRCDGGRAQDAAASRALSLTLTLSCRRDEAAGETRDAQRTTGVSCGFDCSVFEEGPRHEAQCSGLAGEGRGVVWSQTQGLVVLGVSVA